MYWSESTKDRPLLAAIIRPTELFPVPMKPVKTMFGGDMGGIIAYWGLVSGRWLLVVGCWRIFAEMGEWGDNAVVTEMIFSLGSRGRFPTEAR